jgi:hypothetical protein
MIILGMAAGAVLLYFVESYLGFMPAVAVACWLAWPFLHIWRVNRHNSFHPVPKQYFFSSQIIFVRLRQVLNETTYHFSDRWHVISADTEQNRIVAELRFIEKEDRIFDYGDHGSRPEQLRRTLRFEALMKDVEYGGVLQMDFDSRIEGLNLRACDTIVDALVQRIEASLGGGIPVTAAMSSKLSAPPWWLYVVSGLCLVGAAFGSMVLKGIESIVFSVVFLVFLALVLGADVEEVFAPVGIFFGMIIKSAVAGGIALLSAHIAGTLGQGATEWDTHKTPQKPADPRW